MLLIGYFEGIDSERGLEWRCVDSLSLREFLRLGERERVPGHSWLSRMRSRLPLEAHDAVFTWVLQRLAERGHRPTRQWRGLPWPREAEGARRRPMVDAHR
jgi:hypothetical protein